MQGITRVNSRTRRVRTLITLGSSVGLLATGALMSSTGVAQASTTTGAVQANPGAYCGTYGSGITQSSNPKIGPESTWVKKADNCHDINITYTNDSHRAAGDRYGGWLWSNGTWKACSRGDQYLGNGNHNPNVNSAAVPCTDVAAGTKFTIVSKFNTEDTVHINY